MPERLPVQARSIIGNGNAADPESILELEDEWGRRVRGQRAPPKKKFGKVAKEAAQREEAPVEEPAEPSSKENLPLQAQPKPGGRLIRA